MKPILQVLLWASLLSVLAAVSGSAQKSYDGLYDIDSLMNAARKGFDVPAQDAVILLDKLQVRLLEDGRIEKTIHRIIWVATEVATDRYADDRVPYDDVRDSLEVLALRTWRDGRWWDSGPTAKVPTLPFAVREAYDYADRREMMLLHDGVELPCIMELAFKISDRQSTTYFISGLWYFQREEPAVRSILELTSPTKGVLSFQSLAGAPAPLPVGGTEGDRYLWEMEMLPAQPRPHVLENMTNLPQVVWTSSRSWEAFGRDFKNLFDSAVVINPALTGLIDSVLRDARSDGEKADLIARLVAEKVRFIDYPDRYWFDRPRPAVRTYETAYGHRLDRAILAAALMKQAGISAEPVYISDAFGKIDYDVPCMERTSGIWLRVRGDDLEGFYDPSESAVQRGIGPAYNRALWSPGLDVKPKVEFGGAADASSISARLLLAVDAADDTLTGNGYFCATGFLSPYSEVVGVDDQARDFLESAVSDLISDAEIESYNPEVLLPAKVAAGFTCRLVSPEPDDRGRLSLVLGSPSAGLPGKLPGEVKLFHQERTASVVLPSQLKQDLELRLDITGYDRVYIPAPIEIRNEAGTFSLQVEQKDKRVTIRRQLFLAKTFYSPDQWPLLRQLLLAEENPRHRTILLKKEVDKEKHKKD